MSVATISHEARERIATVGRVGDLTLEYVRQDGETVLARSHCRSPWHLFPPIRLDDSGCAYTLLVNPSGGLVGGDRLSIRASLGPQAHVLISTPSANRVYRSLAETSVQAVELSLGTGAILEWVPELTIPFRGARFRQTIYVALASGATLLLWDAIASGRVARGERWSFASLENEIRIVTASGDSVLERYHLVPSNGGAGLAGEWDYVGSLYLISDAVDAKTWKHLQECLASLLDERPGSVLGGISEPAAPGLVVKLAARSAPELTASLSTLWATIREQLWHLPAPALRRY